MRSQMPEEQKELLEEIEPLLESEDGSALRALLCDQRSSDIAEVVELVDNDRRRLIFDVLEMPMAAEVLEKVNEATREQLFDLLGDHEIPTIVSELDHDDAADLLAEMPDEVADKVLGSLPQTDRLQINKLMRYSEDSAGGIMDPLVISVAEDATIAQAVNKIRAAEIDEDFYSVYVVNQEGRFVGDVRLRLLLTRPEQARIGDLIDPDTITVQTDMDQEEVRNIFSKNDLIVASGLATGHLAALEFSTVFTREVRIAFLVALSCGVVGALACTILIHTRMPEDAIEPMRLVFAFGTAMFSAIMVATTLGLFLPFLFRKIGIDPAISSGPLVTTANDSISVAIYMALAVALAA